MLNRRSARLLMAMGIVFLVACLLPWPAPGALAGSLSKENAGKQYQQAMAFYNNLTFQEQGGQREQWLIGVKSFQRVHRTHPTHELAPSCLFMLGRIYHEMARRFANPLDLGEAIAYFQDVFQLFPEHLLADDALYRIAEIYLYDRKAPEEAAKTFTRITTAYADGDMAGPAIAELERLKKMAAGIPGSPAPSPPPLRPVADTKPFPAGGRGLTQIMPVRHWSNADYTRVVIETGAPVSYTHSILPEDGNRPRRLYMDLQGCRLAPGTENKVPVGDGLLKQVRTGQFTADTVRVVIDIESIADYKIFTLLDPFRVVIDAIGKPQSAAKTADSGRAYAPSLPQQLGLGIRRIVLDPGHGGKDPGAIGPKGLLEKDVVLQVAKNLGAHLERELGCEVIFTRNRDIFVPLEERTAIANTSGADLFISIHANAAPSPEVRGVETYFLDFATNKDAMRVAARENATSTHQLSDLQSILLDLMQNTKLNESAKLAEFVQASMVSGLRRSYAQINDLGVKRAPFVVLIGAQMPAVLVEVAFLSNPEEAQRLADATYLQQLTQQIAAGVSQYVTDLNLANLKL